MSDVPLLWHFPVSHFNEKVRWALDLKGIAHVRQALGPGYLPRALLATRQVRLPILFLEGRAISDSTRIIDALERYRPAPPLYPADDGERRRALELEDFFDEELGPAVRTVIIGRTFEDDPKAAIDLLTTGMPSAAAPMMKRVAPAFRAFYSWRHGIDVRTIEHGRQQIDAALERIRAEMRPGGYLVGERFSVADLTAAALLAPIVQPPEMQYRSAVTPPALAALRAELAGDPAFEWTMRMYRQHRGRSAEVDAR